MTEQSEKKRKIVVITKKLLSPLLLDESLSEIDVTGFVNILYPIGLSLILAYTVSLLSKNSWFDDSSYAIIRIITFAMLILYVLYDWDDCHHAIKSDKDATTAFDKILWLTAIFWLSFVTVRYMSDTKNCISSLLGWLLYSVVAALFRDSLIKNKDTVGYASYSSYRNAVVILFTILFVLGLACKIDIIDIRKELKIQPNRDVTLLVGHMGFLISIVIALWLKNLRKIKVFGIQSSQQDDNQALVSEA